ncbi:MAG TPA: O-antigen ligase family protein [Campylobacterales bacterium]|nr:O-antigen ligase family protein [Campylobacterales bacterium]
MRKVVKIIGAEYLNLETAIVCLVGALVFVWPIPHTNAIRYMLIAILSVFVGYLYLKRFDIKKLFFERTTLFFSSILIVLTIWLYIVAIFLCDYTVHSLEEINSQWLLSVFCFFLGLALANIAASKTNILLAVFAAVLLHVLYIFFEAFWLFYESGELQDKLKGLTNGRDRANVLTNIAIAILLSEIFFRTIYHKRILPLNWTFIFLATALSFISLFFEGARLGIVGVFFMFFTLTALALYALKQNKNRFSLLMMTLFASLIALSLLAANIKRDERWNNLFETIAIAVDIETHKAWIDTKLYPLPKLKDGNVVNDSNYERPAWIAAGISFIAESPLGSGFARDAFGLYRTNKYKEGSPTRASHSSLIDFGVGGGVIMVVGWTIFLLGLSFVGLRGFMQRQDYYSLLLLFLTGGFFFRMCIDGVARDHMLEEFMFLAALFLAFAGSRQCKSGA